MDVVMMASRGANRHMMTIMRTRMMRMNTMTMMDRMMRRRLFMMKSRMVC